MRLKNNRWESERKGHSSPRILSMVIMDFDSLIDRFEAEHIAGGDAARVTVLQNAVLNLDYFNRWFSRLTDLLDYRFAARIVEVGFEE